MKELPARSLNYNATPMQFIWSYIGTLLFMLGGCIENSWLSTCLDSQNVAQSSIATVFAAYGIVVTMTSWLSGICVDIFGPRKVIIAGFAIYALSSVLFIHFALPSHNFTAILLTYMGRGAGYPLVCYAFLVRLTIQLDKSTQGFGTSWFWVVFNLGFTIIGPVVAARMLPTLGQINLLWLGMAVALLGSIFMVALERTTYIIQPRQTTVLRELAAGIAIMYERPRIGLPVIVKTINGLGTFGFVVVLPLFLQQKQFTLEGWASIWGATFVTNQVFNIVFGWLGDKIGYRLTIQIFGSILAGIATLIDTGRC